MADDSSNVITLPGRVIPPQPSAPPPKPEQSRPTTIDEPRGAKARARSIYRKERNRLIMSMVTSGSTPEAISASFRARGEPISVTAIKRIIAAELRQAAIDRAELSSVALDQELSRIDGLIRRAHAIIDANCLTCSGMGQSTTGGACRDCRGDGKASHPDTRLRAIREVRALTEARTKLLGLEAPTRHEHSGPQGNPILLEIGDMTTEELDRSIADFNAGAEAARALMPAAAE